MQPSKELFKSRIFSNAFWEWYDNIHPSERHKFMHYKDDMAELYFFNKFFRYRGDLIDEYCSARGKTLPD